MNLSPSLEDYLEEIYRLAVAAGAVRLTDIAAQLNVSLPATNKAVRKLMQLEYIVHEHYGEITVTDRGEELGRFLVERNRLLQEFLVMICAECDVTKEAEAMEHYLSDTTIESIRHLVQFMKDHAEHYQDFMNSIKNRAE